MNPSTNQEALLNASIMETFSHELGKNDNSKCFWCKEEKPWRDNICKALMNLATDLNEIGTNENEAGTSSTRWNNNNPTPSTSTASINIGTNENEAGTSSIRWNNNNPTPSTSTASINIEPSHEEFFGTVQWTDVNDVQHVQQNLV